MTPATETQILEIIRDLPDAALEEVRDFLNFLTWRYQQRTSKTQNNSIIAAMKGKATSGMTTEKILSLTRDEDEQNLSR